MLDSPARGAGPLDDNKNQFPYEIGDLVWLYNIKKVAIVLATFHSEDCINSYLKCFSFQIRGFRYCSVHLITNDGLTISCAATSSYMTNISPRLE